MFSSIIHIGHGALKEYYGDIQFLEWKDLSELYVSKINDVTLDEEKKNFWSLKLYTLYLQFIEIFCINIFAISEGKLFDNLFLSNNKLKEKIDDYFFGTNKKFSEHFLDQYVFGLGDKTKINNLEDKMSNYKGLLEEIMKDYATDRELLNAYKHGFRTKSKGKSSLGIRLEGGLGGVPQTIATYNSEIIYLRKEETASSKIIFECSVHFNWERIAQKFEFLFNMTENTLKILLAGGTEIVIDTLAVTDADLFNKSFGTFRTKRCLVELIKTKNPQS